MISNKMLLRSGFFNVWRPENGYFKNLNEAYYRKLDSMSTVVHIDEALDWLQAGQISGKICEEYSLLEHLNVKVIRFFGSHWNDEIEHGYTSEYQSSQGNIKFSIESEYAFRTNSDLQPCVYFVEIVDVNDSYSIVRVLITTKQCDIYPKLSLNILGSPIYKRKNRLLCLNCSENFAGKIVNYIFEIMADDECSSAFKFLDVSYISTINHEGNKRFRCKRVLNKTSKVCMSLSKEDCLAGVILWMLLKERLDLFNKFSDSTKRRLFAVHKTIKSKYRSYCSENQSEGESEMSISDVGSSISDTNTDTELNSVCDYIAHFFYSSSSTVDILSLKHTLAKCKTDNTFPTNSEINACLVVMLKWMKDPILLQKEANRRTVLLNMMPCEKVLTLKYQSLTPCLDVMCSHEDCFNCPDVKRICYGYIMFSLERWQNEDAA